MEPQITSPRIDTSSAISEDTLFELRTKDYGVLIAKDKESISLARGLIDIIENKLGSKKAIKKEES